MEEGKHEAIPDEPLSLSEFKVSSNLQEIPLLNELVSEQAAILFSEGK